MKTVLMVAPYFIPRRRVGALRPYKFAIHLRSYGYNPVILTISNSEEVYTELERNQLEGIPILKIDPPFDRTTKKDQPKPGSRKKSGLLNWLDKQIPLDSWFLLFLLKYNSIKRRVKKIAPDLIWATGDPWSGLWLGEKLARGLSVPFIADFRDPWTLAEVNLRERSSVSMKIDRWIEKRVLKNADQIVFTSSSTEEKYKSEFALNEHKTNTIYNSFEAEFTVSTDAEPWTEKLSDKHLHMLFFGRFRRLSPASPIINVLIELNKIAPNIASSIKVHSFGEPDWEDLQNIQKAELEQNFIFHDRLVPEKSGSVLKSADLLLLSTHEKREYVIPAKLWDYLSVSVPILSITPNSEIGEIIKKCQAGVHFHPDQKTEIADQLSSFVREKKNKGTVNFSEGNRTTDRSVFEAKESTRQLASLFDKLMTDD